MLILDAWPALPAPIKAAILALARTVAPGWPEKRAAEEALDAADNG